MTFYTRFMKSWAAYNSQFAPATGKAAEKAGWHNGMMNSHSSAMGRSEGDKVQQHREAMLAHQKASQAYQMQASNAAELGQQANAMSKALGMRR
jgi:hypothetical protein